MTGFWVGGYTTGDGGVRRLDPDTGSAPVAVPTADPSFLLASPAHDGLLYAVDEGGDAVVALRGGAVVARVATAGSAPCHLALVDEGRLLVASCYGDGVVSTHAVGPDGLPAPAVPLPAPPPAPNGPHPAQDGPHAHCCHEVDGLLLIADLGTDRVLLYGRAEEGYGFDGAVALPAGCGPRDLLPLPSGAVLVLGEHDSRLHVLDVAGRRIRASVPSTDDPTRGDQAAGMTLAASRLTVGLRGSDRIALLRVGEDDVPVPVDSALTGGTWPRHHAIDGDRLLVANERSGTITALPFRSDDSLGTPGPVATVPAPTFLLAAGGAR
ncbi:lactonase family protein [uncultured Amnibacterium sp.]|uniref:lactonase family protein n=1 Tax=uncultured Amnibacterium sp. TaxID=1631851 RepID=UPI0035C97A8B